ncbi:MAG TPA: lytic transglycosylase domain-containing protein [Vicinamibacterales bacterium]|nr:lytic transglycosylase domain-containing protein [Vicinamibacterales bacterium]
MLTRGLFLATLASLWPAAAGAQIYAWRDANGTLVLSDRAIEKPTAVYKVEGAPSYVTTTPAESPSARERYDSIVLEHCNRHSLRPELVRAVIQVESGYNPRALSPKGAMGLMQLMPDTARLLGVQRPYDPEENIRGGTRYLRLLLDKYQGNEELALAAYNAGSGAVDRHGKRVPPFKETREYVKKVGSAAGSAPPGSRRKLMIYKTLEVVDGRAVPRYSTERPSSGSFDVISR